MDLEAWMQDQITVKAMWPYLPGPASDDGHRPKDGQRIADGVARGAGDLGRQARGALGVALGVQGGSPGILIDEEGGAACCTAL